MFACGIIAEYNPLHLGHARHLQWTRAAAGCAYIVVALGGCFTQRGEPALLDKWARAEMALAAGADAVFELPALFAVRAAEGFARGGVGVLEGLGCVEGLSFGCECDDLALLSEAAACLRAESPAFRAALKEALSRGNSHAKARGAALSACLSTPEALWQAPNTALALEYLRVNRRLRPFVCKRTGDYHARTLGEHASASAIRQALWRGEDVRAALPVESARILTDRWPDRAADPQALDALLLYKLRGMSRAQLAALPEASEGLEGRLLKCLDAAQSRAALLEAMKCKRYTMARLSRLCAHALLGMDRAMAEAIPAPPYARLLGFRATARPLIQKIAATATIPVVTSAAKIKDDPCMALEARTSDLWALCTRGARQAGRDYTEKLLVL